MGYFIVGMLLMGFITLVVTYYIRRITKEEMCDFHDGFRVAQEELICKIPIHPYLNPRNSYEEGWNEAIKQLQV